MSYEEELEALADQAVLRLLAAEKRNPGEFGYIRAATSGTH